jgi:hypothetical protein
MAKKRTSRRAQSTTYLPDHLYSVVFTAARLTDLEPIHSISGVDVGCRHAGIRRDKSGVHLGALVSGRVLASLVAEGRWKASVLGDQTVASVDSLKLVAKGNRFHRKGTLPEGMGRLVDAR